jgi:hypothetical protein
MQAREKNATAARLHDANAQVKDQGVYAHTSLAVRRGAPNATQMQMSRFCSAGRGDGTRRAFDFLSLSPLLVSYRKMSR